MKIYCTYCSPVIVCVNDFSKESTSDSVLRKEMPQMMEAAVSYEFFVSTYETAQWFTVNGTI